VERGAQAVEQLAAEKAAEDTHVEEEAGPTGAPSAVGCETASGYDAVDVGMMDKRLAQGVENGEEAEPGAEMFRVL